MNIVIASGICVAHDAISGAMIEQARVLETIAGVDSVCIVTQHFDRECGVARHTIGDPWQFMRHPAVAGADLVIFHWGIAYELFNALPLIAAEGRAVVHFHNQTPMNLVSDAERPKIQEGLEQIQLVALTGAPVWTMSRYNIETLRALGVASEQIVFMPFPIEAPRPLRRARRSGELRLLTVGRIVPAKGVDVAVEAVAIAREESSGPIRLVIAGNPGLSDPRFLDTLRARIVDLCLTEYVEFELGPTDDRLWELYEWADVVVSPSLHEGLCVPIIEGYVAGCRAIGTAAGNLPFVVQPPDPVVPVGDARALADAILTMAGETFHDARHAAKLVETYSSEATRLALERAILDRSPSHVETA